MENLTFVLSNSTNESLISSYKASCAELGFTEKVSGGVFYGTVSVFGSIGNFLVILVICRTPGLRNIYGIQIANLAVADFIASSTGISLFNYAITQRSFYNFHLAPLSIHIGAAIFHMSIDASLIALACLSFDRFFAVYYPLKHKFFMTFRKLKVMIVVVWLVSVTIIVLLFSKRSIWHATCLYVESSIHKLCVFVIIGSGIAAIVKVFKSSSSVSDINQSHNGGQNSVLHQRNKQVAKTVCFVVLLFAFCWTPSVLARLKNPLLDSASLSSLDFWLTALRFANSAMNPCIYFYRHRNYREALKRTLDC